MLSHLKGQAAFAAAVMQSTPPADVATLGIMTTGDLDRRFAVYRNTFAHSLIEALTTRFPTVTRLVGAEFFRAMAGVYIVEHPPSSPVLQSYGATFPDFLAQFTPVASLPYLPDVARIEVLRGKAYHAVDATPLTTAEVHKAISFGPETVALTFHPSLCVLQSRHPAVSIWRQNQSTAHRALEAPAPEAALIFRHEDDAVVLPIPPYAAHVVAALANGTPLGRVIAADTAITEAISQLLRYALITHVYATHPRSRP